MFLKAKAVVLGLLLLSPLTYALDVPENTAPIVDQANLLNPQQKQELDASLVRFQKEYGPQIQILTIPTLAGDSLEDFSIKVADAWKTGKSGKDDGVILLIAADDHKVRIEVGKGLEGTLPDITAGRIIRDTLVPFFKAGHYSDGIIATTQAIATQLGGELREAPSYESAPAPYQQNDHRQLIIWLIMLLFFILPRIFGGGSYRRNSVGSFAQGMLLGGILGSGRGGGGGWGSGGGFGGGFGGGGGGGFNGGGSSGSW